MKHARTGGPDIAFRLGRRVVSAVADDMSTMQRVGAGVAAALVAVTPFGAWSKVEAQADPVVAGTAIEVGPFDVTVVRVVKTGDLGYLTPAPGNHMLAVVADVTNTGDEPQYSSTLGSAIPAPKGVGVVPQEPLAGLDTDLDSGADDGAEPEAEPSASASPEPGEEDAEEEPDLPSATIVNVADASNIRIFNPGVTYQVALIWEQSDEFTGDEIPVEVVGLDWIDESRLTLDNGYWLPGEVAFQGDLPLKDNTDRTGDGQGQQ
ncbi:hypothetical protein GCM10010413_03260 [Promicromonospora sukumoe]|uniref:Uncharacterized protein n=1 Tax=Promicromonospora sukumoe TaxID=88382 RepID=A0A7W3JEV7_9MICO|nr:hypothetical protein [Promicromonospora sukumoe]MBA8811578.1 hypothetical protein [Promicromonospora sukumoe]